MTLKALNEITYQFDVSRETQDRLQHFVDLTLKWTVKINLIGKSTKDDIWTRHIADSLQLYPLAPKTVKTWLDIGSGGGFPGMVMAICAREKNPDCRFTLVDSDLRKCLFLRTVVRELNLNVDVIDERLQNIVAIPSDIISARALAPLSELLTLSEPHFTANTICLFPKGEGVDCELTTASHQWTMSVTKHPSLTNPSAVILQIGDLARV